MLNVLISLLLGVLLGAVIGWLLGARQNAAARDAEVHPLADELRQQLAAREAALALAQAALAAAQATQRAVENFAQEQRAESGQPPDCFERGCGKRKKTKGVMSDV